MPDDHKAYALSTPLFSSTPSPITSNQTGPITRNFWQGKTRASSCGTSSHFTITPFMQTSNTSSTDEASTKKQSFVSLIGSCIRRLPAISRKLRISHQPPLLHGHHRNRRTFITTASTTPLKGSSPQKRSGTDSSNSAISVPPLGDEEFLPIFKSVLPF